jgi:long-chain acyl-CoA synthetase
VLKLNTLVEVFELVTSGKPRIMAWHHEGAWHYYSSEDIYQRTVNLAKAFRSWGVLKGDRVALLSENRPEWALTDFACLLLGAVDVPIYPTLTPEQSAFMLKDSGARVLALSSEAQWQKLKSVLADTDVVRVVMMDAPQHEGVFSMQELMTRKSHFRDADFDAEARKVMPDDLATIIYTSGTTGTPKGVMLTHRNLASNLEASVNSFGWGEGESYISFLPLSHVTARHVDYIMLAAGVTVYYCPILEDLPRFIQQVRPYNFVSVPRVYEKFRQETERRTNSPVKKTLFDWARKVGRRHRAEFLQGKTPQGWDWKTAERLVFSKVRGAFGGKAEIYISGGAPLGKEIAEWYADLGVRICEGYGLTETSPVISVNLQQRNKPGTVGPPLSNVQVKIADDGELLVRGPSVFKGYWHMPEETRAAFEGDWFKTGDIAHLDGDGFLVITDRKKDLLKTSGGKFIAPQPIENALKTNVLVAYAAVVGDKKKFASVIIAPNFPTLEDWACANSVQFATRAELVQDEKVRALYEGIVADLNTRLARFERLKRIILVADEFSIATGEITPSLKLKRRVVEQKYQPEIASLYREAELAANEVAG